MRDAAERIWATCGEYWRYPTFKDDKTEYVRADLSDALIREAADVLGWYDEQSRLARLIHSEGDAGRQAIAADGGGRASATLAKLRAHLEGEKE